jgi:hypothetical protein
MSERHLTIHFNDGSKLAFDFPQQMADGGNVTTRLQEALKGQYLLVECEGSLMMFPLASIKYIQAYPAPSPVPATAIHGATLAD